MKPINIKCHVDSRPMGSGLLLDGNWVAIWASHSCRGLLVL